MSPSHAPPTLELAPEARRRRLLAAAVTLGLLLAGTVWGHDDHFPFGPFRMYATTQRLDGATTWYRTEGVTADGTVVGIPISRFGIRRAELEGQLPRLRADPALIGALVVAYERRQPHRPPLVELRIVKHRQPLRGGLPDGEPTEEVVATWTR